MLAHHRFGIEDGPNRTTPIAAIANTRECGRYPIVRIVLVALGVQIAMGRVGIDPPVAVRSVLARRLVVEALAEHVDQNNVLPVPDG